MKSPAKVAVSAVLAMILLVAVFLIWWRFSHDMQLATARSAQDSVLVDTRCGPIEYQEAGSGVPLLLVHGSGGGHDQGMAFAGGLAQRGIRVIAMSRFGYLRTPMPADASPAAQADAHVLSNSLGSFSRSSFGSDLKYSPSRSFMPWWIPLP